MQIGPEQLRSNEEAAQHKEHIDAHPPHIADRAPESWQITLQVKDHDHQDRQRPQRIQTVQALGG